MASVEAAPGAIWWSAPSELEPRWSKLAEESWSVWGRILCLEGEWSGEDLTDERTVLPMLQLLQAANEATFIHRRVGTKQQLLHYLRLWFKEQLDFYTLYLGFHGSEGELAVGFREAISL